jgi:2,3-dihydroxyphenylpropionate 1,2-dioxygenase
MSQSSSRRSHAPRPSPGARISAEGGRARRRSRGASAGWRSDRRARPAALIVIAAEHFANFFMNHMQAYRSAWPTPTSPDRGTPAGFASRPPACPECRPVAAPHRRRDERRRRRFAEEWKFDHGIMVPLHF